MTTAAIDISLIGKLFARTPFGKEMSLPQWQSVMNDVIGLATSANALMCVFGADGSGKTTFLQLLQNNTRKTLDTLLIVPATPSTGSGWLLDSLVPWLSSSRHDINSAQKRLAALAESSRAIILCIDAGDSILDQHLTGDLSAMLNLADSCGLKLSILVCCNAAKATVLSSDKATASRIIYKKALPLFAEDQIYDFITLKQQQMGHASDSLTVKLRADIAQNAQGSPALALRLFSAKLGHTLPTSESISVISSAAPLIHATTRKNRPIKNALEKDSGNPSRIEDLLAPSKA